MGRAPNGHATPFKGADGRYHVYVTIGTRPDGRPHRKHIHRKTATEAAEAAAELRQRMHRGNGVITDIHTVEDWLTYWLDNVAKPRLRPGTVRQYHGLIHNHLIPSLGLWRLDGRQRRLEPEYVEAAYAKMRRQGLSDAYVRAAHAVLRKSLQDAMRRGRTGRNVCDMLDPPKPGRRRIGAHTLAEVEAILGAAMAQREPARWLIAMLLGLRQGEVLGLRWHRLQLDGDPPVMRVDSQLQRQRWEHGCDDPAGCASRWCGRRWCVPKYGHGCGGGCGKQLAYVCPDRVQTAPCKQHRNGCPPPCPPGCVRHAARCPKRRDGGLVEVGVKSETSERDVPLPAVVVDELRRTRERQIVRCAQFGERWDPRGLVFTTDVGGPVSPRVDYDAWKRLLKSAGVDDSRLHQARHDAATFLLATGTSSRTVQAILGHSQLTVTERYMDVASDLKRQAVERIAAAMFQQDVTALLQGPKVES
jgi:integrase